MTKEEFDTLFAKFREGIIEDHRAGMLAAFEAGKRAGAAEARGACARIAEGHDTTENVECVTANEIAEQIRAQGAT